jgi:hypothetical protein
MQSLPQQATEAAITKAASAATLGGGTSAVLFGLSSSQWSSIGVIGGLLIALLGLMVNVYFKAQHLKLARIAVKADDMEDQ